MRDEYTASKEASPSQAIMGIGGRLTKPSHREQLVEAKKELELRLQHVTEAITALDKHPEVEYVMEAIGKALHYY
jgi:hypothetical protein